jgi:SAM-dependent methyltransferase
VASRLEELRNAHRLSRTLEGFTRVHLLRTGVHLGIFEALREPVVEGELAERLGLAADLVRSFLRASHAHGLLVRGGGGAYTLHSFTRWLLDSPRAPGLHALLDQAVLGFGPRFEALSELMKGTERPEFGTPEDALRAATVTRLVEEPALRALERVPGARSARRVLDIGCGFGTYLAGFLRRYRDAYGVGVELDPAVAEEARRRLHEAEVSRRVEIRVGDFMTLDLPKGTFDLILINHGLHYFPEAQRGALLRRARARLAEPGVVAIQTPTFADPLPTRWRHGRNPVSSLDLYYRTHRNLHGIPELEEIRETLVDSGFGQTGVVEILAGGSVVYAWGRSGAG